MTISGFRARAILVDGDVRRSEILAKLMRDWDLSVDVFTCGVVAAGAVTERSYVLALLDLDSLATASLQFLHATTLERRATLTLAMSRQDWRAREMRRYGVAGVLEIPTALPQLTDIIRMVRELGEGERAPLPSTALRH